MDRDDRRRPIRTDPSERIRRRWNLPPWRTLLLYGGLGLGATFLLGAVVIYFWILRDLPSISSLRDYHPPIVTTVYAEDNRKAGEIYLERRKVIGLNEMPKYLVQAFISAEDSRFYEHKGIDLIGVLRASLRNIEAGAFVQGGSTITQQVAKTFFLTPERSIKRKLKEAVLSWRLESHLTKDEILHLYLNQIYLGDGSYGVEAASEDYFNKPARGLNLAECAVLAGLAQAPSRYSPLEHPQRARDRQLYVLNRMVENRYISNEQSSRAINTPLVYHRPDPTEEAARYYLQAVRQYLVERYGVEIGLGSGLKVYTPLNIELQRAAVAAVMYGAKDYDRRHGFRGALKHLKQDEVEPFCAAAFQREGGKLAKGRLFSAVIVGQSPERFTVRVGNYQGFVPLSDPSWSSLKPGTLKPGDVIQVRWEGEDQGFRLDQMPKVQAALVALDPATGYVRAVVGGTDFGSSQYNRAMQSRRQPGSAFKPIIYASALEKGYTPATTIMDTPIDLPGHTEDTSWNPRNFEGDYYGPTLFRTGLMRSRNVVTIKILKDIGVDYVVEAARRLGINSPLNRDLSLALGTSGVSLLELTAAYAAFDNLGSRVTPILVTRIEDSSGRVLESSTPRLEPALDPVIACMMSHLLREVVEGGTAFKAKSLGRPVAAKTGTTNNYIDAWFVGFSPSLVAGVWVGHDDERSLGRGETGGLAAAPIWVEFMRRATEGKPVESFPVAPGVVFARIDPRTGQLAAAGSEDGVFECFKEGSAPVEYSQPSTGQGQEDFFRTDVDDEAPMAAPPAPGSGHSGGHQGAAPSSTGY